MPHATEVKGPEGPEDSDFENVMRQMNGPLEGGISFDFLSRDLEPGEKADDAIDYEDIDDDDDLPEEEAAHQAMAGRGREVSEEGDQEMKDVFGGAAEEEGEDLFGDGGEAQEAEHAPEDDLADLFGEGPASPKSDQADHTRDLVFEEEDELHLQPKPLPQQHVLEQQQPSLMTPEFMGPGLPSAQPQPPAMEGLKVEERYEKGPLGPEDEAASPEEDDVPDMDPASLRAWKLQQSLFAMSTAGPDHPPAPPESTEELLHSLFPTFDRNSLPRFLELIPHKKAHFVGKQPLKPPRPVLPTKVNLELSQDQERIFKAGGQAFKRTLESEHAGLVPITDAPQDELKEEQEIRDELEHDLDADEVLPGGVTLQDLRVICTDWDAKDDVPSEMDIEEPPEPVQNVDEEDDWLMEPSQPAKKRKVGRDPMDFIALSHIDLPLLDEPEQATARVAQKVTVDMNDPFILLDERGPESGAQKPKALGAVSAEDVDANMTRRFNQRYNISNDQAYDMLKQNHQNKIRSTLGNFTLEHGMPALRLQWPYYKTELAKAEARSFHRPALSFRPGQTSWFKNPAHVKRKHLKGKDTRSIYDSTKSLSMADNSTALLVEYSEEVPLMLSNFGMSNRMVNYYRRRSAEDDSRPKERLGETVVLLPQDKSPFFIFGHVDPGEVTPTITNTMYRAPVFPHQAKPTDFLVIRSSTGSGGSDYFMRNIEHLHVAGQQFPCVDIPGPHSRKVTTVAKNRMKMLVYRLLKKSPDLRLSISDVTAHIPGTSDMQNRQKVKDFLQHDKDSKYWVPLEPIPDADAIRSWVHPEDVCLLESMQVGQQHLHDTGFGADAETGGGGDDEDEESESFEQQMAPWKATRSFLLASQGKAMLKLHGEGDPTGRGEGFSFVKTSMKGGFKAVGESVEDKLDAQRLKELGGHSYNVARQQKSYETSIRRIWESQKASLSSKIEHSDDAVSDIDEEEEFGKPTPRSEAPTPGPARRDDETTSQFSKMSMSDQKGKVLRIVRHFKDEKGEIVPRETLVWDPRVIRHYMQHRHQQEAVTTKYVFFLSTSLFSIQAIKQTNHNSRLESLQPTGDPEIDARNKRL